MVCLCSISRKYIHKNVCRWLRLEHSYGYRKMTCPLCQSKMRYNLCSNYQCLFWKKARKDAAKYVATTTPGDNWDNPFVLEPCKNCGSARVVIWSISKAQCLYCGVRRSFEPIPNTWYYVSDRNVEEYLGATGGYFCGKCVNVNTGNPS